MCVKTFCKSTERSRETHTSARFPVVLLHQYKQHVAKCYQVKNVTFCLAVRSEMVTYGLSTTLSFMVIILQAEVVSFPSQLGPLHWHYTRIPCIEACSLTAHFLLSCFRYHIIFQANPLHRTRQRCRRKQAACDLTVRACVNVPIRGVHGAGEAALIFYFL